MPDPLTAALEDVPSYSSFMTLEELEASTDRLAEKHPDIVTVAEIGISREGRRIRALIIGDGPCTALLFGCPHPNEPIGTLTLDYLSWRLATDDELRKLLGYKWIIVKVADPDGLKLNEGWLKGPYNIINYALHYYRPAGNKQVEWTFPLKYKNLSFNNPIPETRALMSIIEEEKPDFIYSLHNAGFGGVYYYITEEAPLLYPIYWYIVEREHLPLSLGEPEVPWAVRLGRAIYRMVSTSERYDFLEKYSDKDPGQLIKTGGSSYDYARTFNPSVFEIVTEVPYFYDSRIEDTRPAGVSRREAVLEAISHDKATLKYVEDTYRKVAGKLTLDNRLREALEYYIEVMPDSLDAEEKWALTSKEVEREATVAELFDSRYVNRFYNILLLGMLYRMLMEEVEAGTTSLKEVAKDVRREIEARASWLEENLFYQVIPIVKLVRIQLAAGLYTALYQSLLRHNT